MMDIRIQAIRNDPVVGNGTCSSIDECWDDLDLLEGLKEDKHIVTPKQAIKWARKIELLFLEKACDCRWGEDSDIEISNLEAFKRSCRRNPL